MNAAPAPLVDLHEYQSQAARRGDGPSLRVRELDGLRAVAITMVLAFHFLRVPVPHHHWLDYPTRPLAIGFGGVDLFFVLSGFLVGGILIDTRSRPAALRSFLVVRPQQKNPL